MPFLPPRAAPFAVLLGSAQDAGVPQAGCDCPHCAAARVDAVLVRHAACLGLVDPAAGASWLVDATPDIGAQLALLGSCAPGSRLAGIFLTHAHIGHYLGLAQLGREAMNTAGLPVWATPTMARFLSGNGPWSQLADLGNIVLNPLEVDRPVAISPRLAVTAVAVPHRAEYSDTVAFLIHGPNRTLFYCPDIDRWSDWQHDVADFLAPVDVALLDGTFFGADELAGRAMSDVPHPLVPDTVSRLAGCTCQVSFFHLNHSNPLLHDGPERAWLAAAGRSVGAEGRVWALGETAGPATGEEVDSGHSAM